MRQVPIKGFPGYEITDSGRVWSCRRKVWMKPVLNDGRYYKVTLFGKNLKLHRAVAVAFIPNPENKPQINHINGDKLDNRVENLEFCTQVENMAHAVKCVPQKPQSKPSTKLRESDVLLIKDELAVGKISQSKLTKMFGVSRGCIYKIKYGINHANT